jgi:hypothetical protein
MSDKADGLAALFRRLRSRLHAINASREDLAEATRHASDRQDDDREDDDTPRRIRASKTKDAGHPEAPRSPGASG